MRNYWSYWSEFGMMAIEAQTVVGLRMMKLAQGGAGAQTEAVRMIDEKIHAGQRAILQTMSGRSPASVLKGVHQKVRANRKRLAR